MNTRPPAPDTDDARWLAQERARLAARPGGAGSDVDASDLRVARALRRAPAPALPADFAAQVAALARRHADLGSRLEQRLLRGLALAFALSAAVTVAWFGRSWPADLASALPGGSQAAGWSLLAAACLVGNWGWGALRALATSRERAPA